MVPSRDLDSLRLDEFQLGDFASEFLVVCPKCEGRALVSSLGPGNEYRLTCQKCGFASTDPPKPRRKDSRGMVPRHYLIYGASVDPYFHLPLWLQSPCSGQVLWAYNRPHLSWLEQLVGAKIRNITTGRAHQALAHKLPRWLLSRKNRDEALRAIKRIRAK
jgi:hypothetical protein